MKAVVAALNQEKALVGAFSVIVQLHRLIVYTALVVAACVPAARTSTNGHGLPARPRIKDIFRLGGHTRPGGGGTGAGGGGQLLGCVQGAARGSWPSSQARLASLIDLPARSPNEVVQGDALQSQIIQPWCSSRRQATLEKDSKGERGKRKYPERSQH